MDEVTAEMPWPNSGPNDLLTLFAGPIVRRVERVQTPGDARSGAVEQAP